VVGVVMCGTRYKVFGVVMCSTRYKVFGVVMCGTQYKVFGVVMCGIGLLVTMHAALPSQADIRTHLNTRTTIIAAVNPKPAWTTDKPVSQATKLSGPLLSR
jgi:hypothetical protein